MNTYFSVATLKNVVAHLPEKLAASAGVVAVADALGVHMQLCLLFMFVMAMDVLTRYLAQTAKWWKDTYPQTPYTLYDLWHWRTQSRKWRYFKSGEMRKKFISKVGTYAIILCVMSVCDVAMAIAGSPRFLLSLCTAFLSCTEAVSVLENLQECGSKSAQALFAIINKRKEAIK